MHGASRLTGTRKTHVANGRDCLSGHVPFLAETEVLEPDNALGYRGKSNRARFEWLPIADAR
jgi:hypothetical protein